MLEDLKKIIIDSVWLKWPPEVYILISSFLVLFIDFPKEGLLNFCNHNESLPECLHISIAFKVLSAYLYQGFSGGLESKIICLQCLETWVQSLGWEDLLEEGMATHSCILAWESLWTEVPSGLQSMGSQRVGHD